MARLNIVGTTEGEIALTAATAKTILQLTSPANHRVAIKSFQVSFDGTSGSAEPVLVKLCFQSNDGTLSSATAVVENGASETPQTTVKKTATVEPTTTSTVRMFEVHPQTGYERSFLLDEEIIMSGNTRVGLICTAPAGVNVVGSISAEE